MLKSRVIPEHCSQVMGTREWPLGFRETRPEVTIMWLLWKRRKDFKETHTVRLAYWVWRVAVSERADRLESGDVHSPCTPIKKSPRGVLIVVQDERTADTG